MFSKIIEEKEGQGLINPHHTVVIHRQKKVDKIIETTEGFFHPKDQREISGGTPCKIPVVIFR